MCQWLSVPAVLKCTICASWAESKGLAPFSIFFCKRKEQGDIRAPSAALKRELEKHIGKLGTAIVDSSIQFAVNFMFQSPIIINSLASSLESIHRLKVFPPVPSIYSETGLWVQCVVKILALRALRVLYTWCRTLRKGIVTVTQFFYSGANDHLTDGDLARNEELQLISSKSTVLGTKWKRFNHDWVQ